MSVFAPFVFMAVAFGEIDTFKLFKTIPNISGWLLGKFELRIVLACIPGTTEIMDTNLFVCPIPDSGKVQIIIFQ